MSASFSIGSPYCEQKESGIATGKLDELNEIIDRAADRMPGHREPSPEAERFNRKLLSSFPRFVVVCILVWTFAIFLQGTFTFSRVVEVLCLVFVAGFAIIGVPCACYAEKGVFSIWAMFGFAIVMTCVLWIAGRMMGQVYYAEAVSGMLGYLGIHLSWGFEFALGFLAVLCVLFFTSMGVISVVSAYMRKYMPTVFFAMQKHANEGTRGKAERFFMVPDIIDVKGVIMDPVRNDHKFDFRTSLSISVYLFLLGLMISSYIFLNPLLINVLGWKTMLAIMLMLSMFTPALLLPWQIARGVGAKVASDAPRDYYLWKGAKSRLFSTFATLGAFMMMLILSLYLGNNVLDIIRMYISFMVPLLVISVIYGSFYINSFHETVCDSICDDFCRMKEESGKT